MLEVTAFALVLLLLGDVVRNLFHNWNRINYSIRKGWLIPWDQYWAFWKYR